MNIFSQLHSDVSFIEFGALAALLSQCEQRERQVNAFMKLHADAKEPIVTGEAPWANKLRESLKPTVSIDHSGIATVPIHGTLAHSPDLIDMLYYGVTDSQHVVDMINKCNSDKSVKGVLLDVNSPGGMVMGGADIADAVAQIDKPKVACTSGMMASLGYMIGSQCDKVVSTRNAVVGSIGAVSSFTDFSRMVENAGVKVHTFVNKEATVKGMGIPGTGLNDTHKAYLQERVQSAFDNFKASVLSKRPNVPETAMKGQTYYGHEAKKVGLVDALGNMEFAKSMLREKMR